MQKAIFFLLIICVTSLQAWKMEAGKITVLNTNANTQTPITFRQTYDTIPLVFVLATSQGGDSAALRIKDVTTTGFTIYSVEPDGNDGPHARMTSVPYIAIEPGTHTLPDGTTLVAQSIQTQRFQSKLLAGSSWESVALGGFSTAPTVLAQIQTANNERVDLPVPSAVSQPWMSVAVRGVSAAGFELALERSETTTGTIVLDESIAYLAIDSGLSGANHYFGANDATRIEYESIRSADLIRGWSNPSGYTINFSKSYPDPIVVATKNSRDGSDGGWLRRNSLTTSSIVVNVDEDIANDTERSHTTELAGVMIFSEPFDVEFVYTTTANMLINEVLYNEVSVGLSSDEFVELYVTSSGDLNGFVLSDQDTHHYRFSSHSVTAGEYVILHTGTGVDSVAGGVHHFYMGAVSYLNNNNDDLLLLKPSQDLTTLADATLFNAAPLDYIAYGRNSVGGNVDPIPTSMNAVTLSFNYAFGTELSGAPDGESISLTPNATDSDMAGCWERTTSGNASDNGCVGYIQTVATDATYLHSQTQSNTQMPNIILSKTQQSVYDPVNINTNPKAIPGAVVEYTIDAQNEGLGSASSVVIVDSVPVGMKLCVADVAQCQAALFVDGAPSSTLTLNTVDYSSDGGVTFGAATPDIDGFDTNIDTIRVTLNGTFAPSNGVAHPSFALKIYMGVE